MPVRGDLQGPIPTNGIFRTGVRKTIVSGQKNFHSRIPSALSASRRWKGSQISSITGIISGRRCVCREMYRFKSVRIFSLITP